MKLHLSQTTIASLPPKYVNHFGDFIFYYTDSQITIANIKTGIIYKKIKMEEVQLLAINNGSLFICTNEIIIVDISNLNYYELEKRSEEDLIITPSKKTFDFTVIDTIKISKVLINSIAFYNNEILISQINSKIIKLDNKRKAFTINSSSYVEKVVINEHLFGYYTHEKVVIYNKNNQIVYESINEGIVGVTLRENEVVILEENRIKKWENKEKVIDVSFIIDSCYFNEESITVMSGVVIYELNYNGEILAQVDITDRIKSFSGYVSLGDTSVKRVRLNEVVTECDENLDESESSISALDVSVSDDQTLSQSGSNMKDSSIEQESDNSELESDNNDSDENSITSSGDESKDDLDKLFEDKNDVSDVSLENEDFSSVSVAPNNKNDKFIFLSDSIIFSPDNDIIIHENYNIIKIISFPDNATESVYYNNLLIVATSSGDIKYSEIDAHSTHEYLFNSKIIKVFNDSITSIKHFGEYLVMGSVNGSCSVFRMNITSNLELLRLCNFKFSSSITALDFNENTLAVGTGSNMLHIFKVRSISESEVIFENISTQMLHSKNINHISCSPNYLITSSSDKSCKILDHNGILIKTIQSDKVLNTSYDSKYIAVCSHKVIKILHYTSLTVLSTFQVRKPILSSCFYSGYLLVASDVLRIYDLDKKKCVKSYDLELVNCWSFSFPFLVAENKIVKLTDISENIQNENVEKLRQEKEEELLTDKFIRNKNYKDAIKVLLNSKKDSKLREVIILGSYDDFTLSFLESFMEKGDTKTMIIDKFIKSSGFKHSQILHSIIKKFGVNKVDNTVKTKIASVINKHSSAIEEVYVNFIGMDIIR